MIYKTTAILLLSLFFFFIADCQQIYVPKNIAVDSITLSRFMYVMSRQIMTDLETTPKEKRDGEYYGSKYTLQTLTYNYAGSNKSLDSLRLYVKKMGLSDEEARGYLNIYDTYNHIKLMQRVDDKHSDQEILNWALPIVLRNFKGKAFAQATEPYSHTEAEIEAGWQFALNKIHSRKTDSLYIDSAIMFAQAYLQHLVYKPFLAIGKRATFVADNANFVIQDSTMITMRDGAKVSAVIVRDKKKTTPQPVVLINSIYATADEVNNAKDIVGHGYVGVILNTRGKYVSAATIEPWEHDADDVYDAIDWISKQSWCDGKVGMYGGSYLGFTQWAATKKLHPALKTIVPQVAAAPGIDFPAPNGIYTTYSLRWLRYVTKSKLTDNTEFSNMTHWNSAFNNWYKSGSAYDKLDSIEGQPSGIFQRWVQHPDYDKYWQRMIPYQRDFSKINIPVLTITGYFDGEQYGALYYYKQHHLWNAAANHYLVIGPYDHFGAQGHPSSIVNGYKIDEVAKIDIDKLVFKWLDFVLKGGAKPALLKDTVNYQIMGENKWGHAASIKKLNTHMLNFYLSANKTGKFNKLSHTKTEDVINQTVDFTKRDTVSISDTRNIYSDSLDTEGVVSFVSDRLKNDIVITGQFAANLMASINKKDMDVVISVKVQQPYGKYFYLSSAMQRASYSKKRERRQLLMPGVKENIPVTGTFVSRRITKGSRIIVQIGVSKNAYLQINYGTGKDVATETIADAKQPLQIKWYGSSLIQIPVAN